MLTQSSSWDDAVNGAVRKRTEALHPDDRTKYRSLAEIMRVTKKMEEVSVKYYDDILCQECHDGGFDDEILLCDRCDLGYHLFCLRPIIARVPSGPWFCPSCSNKRTIRSFPTIQRKIVDFFKIRKHKDEDAERKCEISVQDGKRRRRRSIALSRQKKQRRILPYTPSEDENQRLRQMASLATALTTLKMEFSDNLTYIYNMASKCANRALLEIGGMQVLAREDKETLELCKTMYMRGECPPLLVVFDPLEGFTVQADGYIKDMTFITEYAGDVDYLKNREHDDCDSMMTLLLTEDPSKSLVICPDKRGNIARFINGINNHSLESKKKQNVRCVRYNIDGKSRVLLVACRDILPGERLYYDYNAYEHEYPTEHFI